MRRASRIYIINGYHYESRNCVLDYSPMNQMELSHVKELANEIDVSDQSEEGDLWCIALVPIHQRTV